MKKISLVALLLPILAMAEVPGEGHPVWDEIVGCYRTLEVDGQAVNDRGFSNHGRIQKGIAWALLSIDRKVIPAYDMIVFRETKDEVAYSDVGFAFFEMGEYFKKGDWHAWEFEGQVRYAPQPDITFTLSHRVEFRRLSATRIELRNFIEIQETDEFNLDRTYVLEAKGCSE